MKRIFTSLLMFAATLCASVAVAEEPEYAIPQDWNNNRSVPSERLVYNMTINGATKDGKPAPFSVKLNERGGSQAFVFVDKTSEIIDLSANDVVKVDLEHGIEWMHSYLYIDYNHDGTFDENTELVSYSFYSENDENWGYDSANNFKKNGNVTLDLPEFKVPADIASVTTRMRLKIDWNSKNPVGNPASNNSIGANRGSIFDFTVNVHGAAPVVEKYAVTIDNPEGAVLNLTNAEGSEVLSGDKVEKGTKLTMGYDLESLAYEFKGYKVNGVEQSANTFTVEGPTTVSANVSIKSYTLNIVSAEGGEINVAKVNELSGEKTPVKSGEKVAYDDKLAITATPAEGYELKNILLNGQAKTAEEVAVLLVEDAIVQEGAINVSAEFQKVAPVEPTYAGPSASDNYRNRDDRRLKNITIAGATLNGEAQPFTFTLNNEPDQPTVYMDESATVLEATAGDVIDVSWTFRTLTEWTHYYLYIDYNHDGVFNETNELVSFTYFSETDKDGVNSLGQVVPESQRGVAMTSLPQFQIPEGQGNVKTRIRFKADWNSKNPLGNPTQPIGGNGGTILDFTINIHAKEAAAKFPITLVDPVNGTYTVKNAAGGVINDGMEVEAGTELTIETVADEGYEVDQILVNNSPVAAGEKVTVNGATTIEVRFKEAAKMWAVNIHTSEGGSAAVIDYNAKEYVDGDKIADGTMLEGIQVRPNAGYTLTSLIVNGSEEVNNVFYAPNKVIILMYSQPVHGDLNINAEFTAETGIGEAALAEVSYSAEAQSLHIPAGAYAVVYNAAGQQVMNVQGGQTVSTANLANGAYIVRVVAENSVKVIKFVQK